VDITLDNDDMGAGTFELDLRGVIAATANTNGATVSVGDSVGTLTIKDSPGNDSISVGLGAGTFTVSLAGGGTDTINIASGTTNAVTIQGWAVGDVINIVAAGDLSAIAVTTTPGILLSGVAATVAATDGTTAFVLAGNGTGGQAAMQISGALTATTNGGAVEVAVIAAGLVTAVGNGNFMTIALDNGTDTGIYRLTRITDAGGTAGVIDNAGDFSVVLLATLVGVSDAGVLVAGSIV
jgi:hypothetical protein